jgi:hypothetical protein
MLPGLAPKALSRGFTTRAVDGFVGAIGNTPLVCFTNTLFKLSFSRT